MDPHIFKQENASFADGDVLIEVEIDEHPIKLELKQETDFREMVSTELDQQNAVNQESHYIIDGVHMNMKIEEHLIYIEPKQEIDCIDLVSKMDQQNPIKQERDTTGNDLDYHKEDVHMDVKIEEHPIDIEKPYQCRYCEKRIQLGEKPYQCGYCNKCFTQKSSMIEHQKTHTLGKPYQCSICNKCFSCKSDLVKHQRIHLDKKLCQCSYCNKYFTYKPILVQPKKIQKCSFCDKDFLYNSNFIIHMRKHTREKPYKCNQCGNAFSSNSDLNKHLKSHTGEKTFQQGQTGVLILKENLMSTPALNYYSSLPAYQISPNTPEQKPTGETPIAPNGQPAPAFQCSQCDKAFSKNRFLKRHLRTHNEEKIFQCSQCHETFPYNSYLKRHLLRTHTGEKTFHCSHCDKTFSGNSYLKRHLTTHAVEKPYKCSQCGKAFSINSDLNAHLKRVHTSKSQKKAPYKGLISIFE